MLQKLYGSTAAALYTQVTFLNATWHCGLRKLQLATTPILQAADFNKTARFYYMKAEDTYYKANDAASYDDWKRARHQWDVRPGGDRSHAILRQHFGGA